MWVFAYVVSFAFLAGGSVGSSDGVLLGDSLGVQGDGIVVKEGHQEEDEYLK